MRNVKSSTHLSVFVLSFLHLHSRFTILLALLQGEESLVLQLVPILGGALVSSVCSICELCRETRCNFDPLQWASDSMLHASFGYGWIALEPLGKSEELRLTLGGHSPLFKINIKVVVKLVLISLQSHYLNAIFKIMVVFLKNESFAAALVSVSFQCARLSCPAPNGHRRRSRHTCPQI